jgi:hypothetical protein
VHFSGAITRGWSSSASIANTLGGQTNRVGLLEQLRSLEAFQVKEHDLICSLSDNNRSKGIEEHLNSRITYSVLSVAAISLRTSRNLLHGYDSGDLSMIPTK